MICRTKHLKILLITILFIILFSIGSACAEHYAVLVVSDDQMESSVDEHGARLQQTIEAYVRYLEADGNSVEVFGSVRIKGKKAFVYPNESGVFDWGASDTGKNDSYFRWTLYQLENKTYDKIVVLTGQLRNEQEKMIGQMWFASNSETPIVLYGTAPMPKGKSLLNVYQDASGARITLSGEENEDGFTSYGNIKVKETEAFNADTALFDLINISCEERVPLGSGGVTIPEVLTERNMLVIKGTDLSDLKILVNEQDDYRISTDRNDVSEHVWYSPAISIGQENVYIIQIPDTLTGNVKVAGNEISAVLYYALNSQFDEIIQKSNLTQDGLHYETDGSVTISLSTEKLIQDIKLLFPEMSFQARITPLDGSEPFILYADNNETIHWDTNLDADTDVLVALYPSENNRKMLANQSFRYRPVTSVMKSLQPQITKSTESDSVHKRQSIEYFIKLNGANGENDQEKQQVSDAISNAVIKVLDENGNQIDADIKKNDIDDTLVVSLTAPSVSGNYQWKVLISSGADSVLKWEKDISLPLMAIENHTPVCHSELLDKNISKTIQPGEKAVIDLPSGLFTDGDQDPLTVHYSESFAGLDTRTESFVLDYSENNHAQIADLDQFGVWKLEIYAEDNEGAKSDSVTVYVEVINGNTAPAIDENIKPEEETTVSLLRLSDYQLKIPEGLFTDAEGNRITVYVSLTNAADDVLQESYTGEKGKSPVWKRELDQFGLWKVEVFAEDEHGLQSEAFSFRVELKDALSKLDGVLRTVPERPVKGKKIRLELELDWPEEFANLPVREWLQDCDVTARSTDGTEYPMHLSGDSLVFTTDEILMPETEADFNYSVSVKSKEGINPQKHFTKFNNVSFTLHNSAPVSSYTASSEEHSAYIFELKDYLISIPGDLFADKEGDPFKVKIEFEDEKGNVVSGPELEGSKQTEINLPNFGQWTVKATATDSEGAASDQIIVHQANIKNLKLIIIIAGSAFILLVIVMIVVIRHIHEKRKARFLGNEYIVFKYNRENVSKQIKMKAEDSNFVPLTAFACGINILLTDAQWNNLKDWAIYPTHDEKPIFKKMKNTNETAHEIDLGDGLSVSING